MKNHHFLLKLISILNELFVIVDKRLIYRYLIVD